MAAGAGLAAAVLVALAGSAALACDYPGPPPGSGAARAQTGDILSAAYSNATDRYDHGILGDTIEAAGLHAMTANKDECEFFVLLPDTRVFEDTAPRIADLDGDGRNEIIAVETDLHLGAQLAIYGLRRGELTRLAATPPIGQPHRWLAPAGIADLDGDGHLEIAYVDRPHLTKVLRVWRYRHGRLDEIAAIGGLTNHKIGDSFIQGGIAACADATSILTADANWRRIMRTTLTGGKLTTTAVARYTGPDSFAPHLACN